MNAEPIQLPPATRPILFVIVDTEEEFDWSAPFSRDNISVGAVSQIGRVQRIFDRYRITPTYVVDFPIATRVEALDPLLEILGEGRCSIGAHLHPWVNPPFEEALNGPNSFACNLGAVLESKKLERLVEVIGSNLGIAPRIYKAGRYGFGRSTVALLPGLGFEVDVSINPYMDYSDQGGPSFAAFDPTPFLFGPARKLLEIPCTLGYAGVMGRFGTTLHRLADARPLRRARLVGALARLSLVNRIMLSPEGSSETELRALTRALLAQGVRTFALTFHSPSVEPGHTPYVRTRADLQGFLRTIESYCDFFLGQLGGVTTTPEDFKRSLPPCTASAPTGGTHGSGEGRPS